MAGFGGTVDRGGLVGGFGGTVEGCKSLIGQEVDVWQVEHWIRDFDISCDFARTQPRTPTHDHESQLTAITNHDSLSRPQPRTPRLTDHRPT